MTTVGPLCNEETIIYGVEFPTDPDNLNAPWEFAETTYDTLGAALANIAWETPNRIVPLAKTVVIVRSDGPLPIERADREQALELARTAHLNRQDR